MKAIILAAGMGTRLEQKRPKCLAKVGSKRLIDHQIDALWSWVDGIYVVTGFKAERVREAVGNRAGYVHNDAYATTNSLASLRRALDVLGAQDVIVVNSDVLFHPAVVEELLGTSAGSIAYDSSVRWDPEQMKLLIRNGRLVSMGKSIPKKYSCGENVGLFRMSAEKSMRVAKVADRILEKNPRAWAPTALSASPRGLNCVDIAGMPWHEIDYPSDLAYARRVVLPAIEVE